LPYSALKRRERFAQDEAFLFQVAQVTETNPILKNKEAPILVMIQVL